MPVYSLRCAQPPAGRLLGAIQHSGDYLRRTDRSYFVCAPLEHDAAFRLFHAASAEAGQPCPEVVEVTRVAGGLKPKLTRWLRERVGDR